jgi:hypothetical protein
MNWIGGKRSRVAGGGKDQRVVQQQKRYFAKVRKRVMSMGISDVPVSSSSTAWGGSEGLGRQEPVRGERKRREDVEFDVVVGRKGNAGIGLGGEERDTEVVPLGGKVPAQVEGEEREDIKTWKRRLLEAEDWVCTALAAPLAKKRRAAPRMVGASAPETQRVLRAVSLRASLADTEEQEEYRYLPDTGFNAFRPLSQGGYVRIGRGVVDERRIGTLAAASGGEEKKLGDECSQDTILFEDEDEVGGSMPELAEALRHEKFWRDRGPVEDDLDKLEGELDGEQIPFIPSSSSGTPQQFANPFAMGYPTSRPPERFLLGSLPSSTSSEVPQGGGGEGQLLREIDDLAAVIRIPRFTTPVTDRRPLSHTPSSATKHLTHFVSQVPESDGIDQASEEGDLDDEELDRMVIVPRGYAMDELRIEDQKLESKPDDESVVAYASSSRGFTSSKSARDRSLSPDPALENLNTSWRNFIQGNGVDSELQPQSDPRTRNAEETLVENEVLISATVTNIASAPQSPRDSWQDFITRTPPHLPSPPTAPKLTFTESESRAWRDFVLASSWLSSLSAERSTVATPSLPGSSEGGSDAAEAGTVAERDECDLLGGVGVMESMSVHASPSLKSMLGGGGWRRPKPFVGVPVGEGGQGVEEIEEW